MAVAYLDEQLLPLIFIFIDKGYQTEKSTQLIPPVARTYKGCYN
jgi:hypothetical protein